METVGWDLLLLDSEGLHFGLAMAHKVVGLMLEIKEYMTDHCLCLETHYQTLQRHQLQERMCQRGLEQRSCPSVCFQKKNYVKPGSQQKTHVHTQFPKALLTVTDFLVTLWLCQTEKPTRQGKYRWKEASKKSQSISQTFLCVFPEKRIEKKAVLENAYCKNVRSFPKRHSAPKMRS